MSARNRRLGYAFVEANENFPKRGRPRPGKRKGLSFAGGRRVVAASKNLAKATTGRFIAGAPWLLKFSFPTDFVVSGLF
jgi:hypothetical protein